MSNAIDLEEAKRRLEHAKKHVAAVAADPSAIDDDSQLPKLIKRVQERGRAFLTDAGIGYFHAPGATALRIESEEFRMFVAAVARENRMTIRAALVKEVATNLLGDAYAGGRTNVHLRVAGDGREVVYVHLGQHEVVKITPSGWSVESWANQVEPPAIFVQPPGMKPLPPPTRGGSIHDLRRVLVAKEEDFPLIALWLLSAFFPRSVSPIHGLVGGEGSAKSTGTEFVRALVDPNVRPHRALPKSERDLAIAAQHAHVNAFDNLSGLSNDMSDALCRCATGGGLGTRKNYSDADEIVFDVQRPIILNGIADVSQRADLGSRTLLVRIERPKQRIVASELWTMFEAIRPGILGALFDGMSAAMAGVADVPTPQIRLAEPVRRFLAAEKTLRFAEGATQHAIAKSKRDQQEVSIDASPVATAVARFVEAKKKWEGTTTQLFTELATPLYRDLDATKTWPKSANAFSSELARVATALAEARNIVAKRDTAGRGDDKRGVWQLELVGVDGVDPGSMSG